MIESILYVVSLGILRLTGRIDSSEKHKIINFWIRALTQTYKIKRKKRINLEINSFLLFYSL